jgi:hypothetical protein
MIVEQAVRQPNEGVRSIPVLLGGHHSPNPSAKKEFEGREVVVGSRCADPRLAHANAESRYFDMLWLDTDGTPSSPEEASGTITLAGSVAVGTYDGLRRVVSGETVSLRLTSPPHGCRVGNAPDRARQRAAALSLEGRP